MFTKIKELVTDEKVLELLNEVEDKFNLVSEELKKNDKKIVDMDLSRQKYKNFTKNVKEVLGIEENEELSIETLNSKISKLKTHTDSDTENLLKKDIENLQKQIKENEKAFNDKITSKDKELFKIKFDVRGKDALKNIKFKSDKAYEFIYGELIKGAEFDPELNDFVYKNEDGTPKRNKDTSNYTIEQRAEEIKTSGDYDDFFVADVQSGSGTGQANGSGSSDEFDQYMDSLK